MNRGSVWQTIVSWHADSGDGVYDWSQGIRAAVGISVPTGIGLITGHVSWGVLTALAALWTLMCDMGGAYRQKAATIAGSGLVILLAYVYGAWITQSVPGYIVGVFVWAFALTLLGVAGNAAAQAGLIGTTIVVVAVVLNAPNEFWIRLLLCTIGVLWAAILILALWPVRAFLPLFQAISKSSDRLGDVVDSVWVGAPKSGSGASNLQVALAYDALLSSIEESRRIWGAVRARRAGPSLRSTQLLDLIENLDAAGKTVIAFRGILNLTGREEWFDSLREELRGFTEALARLSREVGAAVARRGAIVDATILEAATGKLLPRLQELDSSAKYDFSRHELRRTAESLAKEFTWLAETSGLLKTGENRPRATARKPDRPRIERFKSLVEIRNNLSFQSSSFRHALRLAAASALAALAASAFHVTRGYWIPMTVVVVLKPNFGGTLQRAMQRITGTVAGALLAALLLWWVQDFSWLLLILALLSFATLTLRWANYVAFSMALTPMIMVILDLAHPGTVTDSFLRIVHTIIGGGLAIVCGYLLFPVWERSQLPAQLADAYRTTALFLRALFALGQEPLSVTEMRKRSGLAVANAVNAGQRLLSEPPHLRGDVEPLLASINFCRDIFYSLSAMAHLPKEKLEQIRSEIVQPIARELADDLDRLAVNLQSSQPPKPLPKDFGVLNGWENEVQHGAQGGAPDKATNSWTLFYLNALIDQVKLAHDAVARLEQKEGR
ncbi:MAG: FUSC family protein [Verrucomicrobia bacterium]|nr:FUSC family protein [Verrucomicrobiota bacterium]